MQENGIVKNKNLPINLEGAEIWVKQKMWAYLKTYLKGQR